MALPELTRFVVDRYLASGAWQRQSFHQLVDELAAKQPHVEAVCDQTRRLTHADLVAESSSLARFLLDAGIENGECVALQSANRVEILVVHLACSRAGATFVPVSDAWRQVELRHVLGLAQARVVLVPPSAPEFDFLAEVEAMRGDLPGLELAASVDGSGDFDLREVLARRGEPVTRAPDPDAPRFVMASSGTTNVPKLSLWTDNNLWCFGRLWSDAVEIEPGDRMVGIAPAGTGATGYVFGVLFPVMAGATSIVLQRWTPAGAVALLEAEHATHAAGIPTQLIKMLDEEGLSPERFPALRVVTNAGAAMPPSAAEAVERVFGCRVQAVYGATDGGVPLMTRISDPAEKRYTTVGRVVADTDFLIVDEELQEVAPGLPGELLWRGPTKSFGYLNEPDRTTETFWGEGYYRSGDLGQMDPEGYVRVVGRSKDVIIRGGQNISPREIEEAVLRHPSVVEAVAVGLPDRVYGERLCVAVSLRPGRALDLPELAGFLAGSGIAAYKVPDRLELFEELPKNASGKTGKDDVKRLILEREAVGIVHSERSE